MTGIGTVSAGEMFTEQVELKGRTTDPANTEAGEYWVRVDQTSSDPQIVAELRRQNTSSVSKIPLFADSEEANLDSQMVRGPSVVLDDGTVGFIAQTTDSAAKFGSPRVVTAAGTEYLSHNSLGLIPDSGVSRWKFEQDVADSWNGNDWTDNTSAGFTTNAKVGDYAKEFDGNDYLELGDIINETGAWTLTAWVYLTDSDRSMFYSTDEDNTDPRGFQFKAESDDTIQFFDGHDALLTTATLSRNTWQFVALATENDGNATVDVDGTKEDFSANLNDTNNSLYMGVRSSSKSNDHLTGRVDDGRYYSKKLSDTELDNLRTTGSI